MSAAHTPGPWAWFGNRSGGVYLATVHGGRKYVMGFSRYGMNGAQPVFRRNDRMVPAAELVEFQVGDGAARGFKQAATDTSVYRYDVSGIDNADARLIAAAPDGLELAEDAVPILEAILDQREEEWGHEDEILRDLLNRTRAFIAKATGQEGGAL